MKGGMQERSNVRKKGCRKGGIQERMDAGQYGCRQMTDAGQEGYRTGGMQEKGMK